eukprot:Gb_29158 [translate_table: standard]
MARATTNNKFVSVNLNKSYGHPAVSSITPNSTAGRTRQGSHGAMLLLSRPSRAQQPPAQKGSSKIAAPPPMNLPSLRKEYAGNDLAIAAAGSTGSLRWNNKADEAETPSRSAALSADSTWGASNLSRGEEPRPSLATPAQPVEKAAVLRGEDFPTLQASIPRPITPQQRQKELQQKQRQRQDELNEQKLKLQQLSQQGPRDDLSLGPPLQAAPTITPQLKPRQHQNPSKESAPAEQPPWKSDGYFSRPPPLIQLNQTSNWADDDRDTGQNPHPQSERDQYFSGNYRDTGQKMRVQSDRDLSRINLFSNGDSESASSLLQRSSSVRRSTWDVQSHDVGFGMMGHDGKEINSDSADSFKDGYRDNSYGRESLSSRDGRDGSFKRVSEVGTEGNFGRDVGFNREDFGRTGSFRKENELGRDVFRQSNFDRDSYGRMGFQSWEPSSSQDRFTRRDNMSWVSRDSYRKDGGYQNNGRGRYRNQIDRTGGFQNNGHYSHTLNKSSFSQGSRGLAMYDPILNFSREKSSFSSNSQPYSEDPFMKEFTDVPGLDFRDPFGGVVATEIRVPRKKKDEAKQTDFYDPVRETFEEELERVQRMQEQERQKKIEDQEKALELARKEQEERECLAREEEERQRSLEEEAREAARRAEQEALEAMRREEEERRAREEEKKRILLEEERRKEAAKQKLVELEERIAKREAEKKRETEASKLADEEPVKGKPLKHRDDPRLRGAEEWEVEERVVGRVTSSSSSESSIKGSPLETGPRMQISRHENASVPARMKHLHTWRSELENGNGPSFVSQTINEAADLSNVYSSANQNSLQGGGYMQRETFGGPVPSFFRERGESELQQQVKDRMPYLNVQRWNSGDDSGKYPGTFDADGEFLENPMKGDEEVRWGQEKLDQWQAQDRTHLSSSVSYIQSSEADTFAFGRSRHSVRQPCVLPPPSLTTFQKASPKNDSEHPLSSAQSNDRPRNFPPQGVIETQVQLSTEEESNEKSALSEIASSQQDDHVIDFAVQSKSHSHSYVSSLPSSPGYVSHDELENMEVSGLSEAEEQIDLSCRDDTVHSTASEEELKSDAVITNDVSPLNAVEQADQEKDGKWVIEADDYFAQDQEYVEEGVDIEEDWEYEDLQDEEQKYDLQEEEQKVDTKNADEDLDVSASVGGGEFETSVFEELGVPDENTESEFCKGDNHLHDVMSLERQPSIWEGYGQNEVLPNQVTQFPEVQAENLLKQEKNLEELQQRTINHISVQQVPVPGSSELIKMAPSQSGQPDVENFGNSLVHQQPLPASNLSLPTSSQVHSPLTPMPTLLSQSEMPIHLQFGLFPGTSLLPATIPAIQFGSIQMPFHLYSQVDPQLTHLHPSQPPMFQFGQYSHPPSLSQGLMPLTLQPLPVVRSNVSVHHPLGQPDLSPPTQHTQASLPLQSLENELLQDSKPVSQVDTLQLTLNTAQVELQAAMESNGLQTRRNGPDNDMLPAQRNVQIVSTFESGSLEHLSDPSSKITMEEQTKLAHSDDEMDGQLNYPVSNKILKSMGTTRGHLQHAQTQYTSIHCHSSGRRGGRMRGARAFARWRERRMNYEARSSGPIAAESMQTGISDVSHSHIKHGCQNARQNEFRNFERVERNRGVNLGSNNLHGYGQKLESYVGRNSMNNPTNRENQKESAMKLIPSESWSTEGSRSGLHRHQYKRQVERKLGTKASPRSGGRGPLLKSMSEVGVDAPLQSGVVRIFEQPGIEAPSDEDDFIEVRSKRQILNDRREQREKLMREKFKYLKVKEQAAWKQRPPVKFSAQGAPNMVASTSGGGRPSLPTSGPIVVESSPAPIEGSNLSNTGSSALLAPVPPQALAPIGTPAVNNDDTADKILNSAKTDAEPTVCLTFASQTLAQESTSTTATEAWGGTQTNHQLVGYCGDTFRGCSVSLTGRVLPSSLCLHAHNLLICRFASCARVLEVVSFTQIQLEEAMKPLRFDSSLAPQPQADRGSMIPESGMPHAKPLCSVSVPLSSLLAGEKIQFGAVTSPALLSPGSYPFSPETMIGVDSSLSSTLDCSMDSHSSATETDALTFSNTVKCGPPAADSCTQMDSEADAEAAASAVAVAGISSDEPIGNGLSCVETSDVEAGVASTLPVIVPAKSEDSMAVSLPADLSVETTSLTLQNSSGPVLPSHSGPPSHFSCLEMGPMLGGPIFAFGQREEAAPLSQGLKCSTSLEQVLAGVGAGSAGGWQQHHSGLDSYRTPPSFTSPFAGPVPGIQGPPHMLVYTNPFAPVGQFGQLGLSFMGAAYLPSGKQPDWKHHVVSTNLSGFGLEEGDIGSLGVMTDQHSANVPTPVQHMAPGSSMMPIAPQHMAPGSSMMPIAPPLGLFDMSLSSSFQPSADWPMQTQWSHVPQPPPNNMPMSGSFVGLSMPLHPTDIPPLQSSYSLHTIQTSNSCFHQVPPFKSAGTRSYSSVDAASQFPDELGLEDSVSSCSSSFLAAQNASSSRTNASNSILHGSSVSTNHKGQRGKRTSRPVRASESHSIGESGVAVGKNATALIHSLTGSQSAVSRFQSQGVVQTSGHCRPTLDYSEQRGFAQKQVGQKTSFANEWSGQSHRKVGGQGRPLISDRGMAGDKSFASSKMKQVYVVKPTSSLRNMGTAASSNTKAYSTTQR